jgi:predicted alpha/beta superfamily hydrolase
MIKTIILFIFFFVSPFYTQSTLKSVTINVISKNLDDSSKIFISGNKLQLGNWQPDKIRLSKIELNKWGKTFLFEQNTSLEFKFTKGNWNSEALDENGNIPGNNTINVLNDTSIIYNIKNWNDGKSKINFNGKITGNINYHKQLKFNGILPRDIVVWLPPDYEQNLEEYYPVLYMHDGQNLFDPNSSFTKIDWQMDEAADSLIRKNKIKPIIIVGIYNTTDRYEEYSPTSKGNYYMQFITTKLKPIIDSNYRTLKDRKNTAVGGSSMGGLISFMLIWNYPNYFSKAACFSPAFKYRDFDYTQTIKNFQGNKKEINIYLDNGGVGLDTQLQQGVDLMIDVLKEKYFIFGKDLFVVIDSTADHNESAWAKRVPQMLQILFGN